MGLIGAMVAFGHASQSSLGRQIRNQYLGWLAVNLVWGFMGSGVDNYAHIGGFAAGFAVAWLGGTPVRSTRARETAWRIAAVACVLATVYCFWLMYHFYNSPEQLREMLSA
jgi:rhomboid protease GluP